LDAQKHPGTTRQLELALFGGQDNDAARLTFSSMRDANLGQTVGATRIAEKTHMACRLSLSQLRPGNLCLAIIGVHLVNAPPFTDFDHRHHPFGHLTAEGVGNVATHLLLAIRAWIRGPFGGVSAS